MDEPNILDVLNKGVIHLRKKAKVLEEEADRDYSFKARLFREVLRRANVLEILSLELSKCQPLTPESVNALRSMLMGDQGWVSREPFEEWGK